MRRVIAACCLSYAVMIAVFVAALVLALKLSSDSHIRSNLSDAVKLRLLTAEDQTSPYGGMVLTDDECVSLTLNLSNEDKSVIYRIAASPWMGPQPAKFCELCACLVNAIKDPSAKADYSYFRFWHGYQVYVRPMLSVMSYSDMRRLNAILLFSAFGLFCYQFARVFGLLAWPILVVSFAYAGDLLGASLVAVHAVPLTWLFLSIAIIGVVLDRRGTDAAVTITVFAAGAVYNFLSLLYNPPLALALLNFLVLAKRLSEPGEPRFLRALTETIAITLIWLSGYGLAWLAKWVLAASLFGVDAVATNVMDAASGASYHDSEAQAEWIRSMGFIDPSWIILSRAPNLLVLIAVAWGVAITVLAWRAVSGRLSREALLTFLVLQLPLLIPITWSWILRSASVEHIGFTYRNFVPLAVLPLLATLLITAGSRAPTDRILKDDPREVNGRKIRGAI